MNNFKKILYPAIGLIVIGAAVILFIKSTHFLSKSIDKPSSVTGADVQNDVSKVDTTKGNEVGNRLGYQLGDAVDPNNVAVNSDSSLNGNATDTTQTTPSDQTANTTTNQTGNQNTGTGTTQSHEDKSSLS